MTDPTPARWDMDWSDNETREERPDPGALSGLSAAKEALGRAIPVVREEWGDIYEVELDEAEGWALDNADFKVIVEAVRAVNRPDPSMLLGITGLAERYGVQPNTVAVWTIRHEVFPQPIIQVGGRVRVWWVPDVDEWVAGRQ